MWYFCWHAKRIWCFLYQSLNIVVHNDDSNHITQIENKMFWSSYDSNLTTVTYGVSQGSVLGPLLFLIYLNDLNQAIKFCKVHHFADDRNLFHFSISVNRLSKFVNLHSKNLVNWLNVSYFETPKEKIKWFKETHVHS